MVIGVCVAGGRKEAVGVDICGKVDEKQWDSVGGGSCLPPSGPQGIRELGDRTLSCRSAQPSSGQD